MVVADQNTKELVEEDVGLACPPFDEEDFMAAEASFFDLSEQVFFSGIEGNHKGKPYMFVCLRTWSDHIRSWFLFQLMWFVSCWSGAERVQGSSGNLNAVQIMQKKHGKGKDMKVLEQVYKHKENAPQDTKAETKAERIESDKKTSTKASIVDDKVSFENRINLAKRKLQESYANIGKG